MRAGSRCLGAVVLSLSLLLVGCGGGITAPDLFVVTRTGSGSTGGSAARLTLLINEEGGVRCNGGPPLKLSDPQLVQARAIQEEIHDQAVKHLVLAPLPGSVFSYSLRDVDGSVRFADNSAGQPKVFHQLALLVLQVGQTVCHLPA